VSTRSPEESFPFGQNLPGNDEQETNVSRTARKAAIEHEKPRRDPLTRERVIDAALRIMDAEGVEAVTMRRIGRELGVEAMSLYNHVRDKDDILDGISEAVMGRFEIPPSTGDWTQDVRALAREWRRLLGLHPGVMQLLAERHKPLEGMAVYRPMNAALEAIAGARLSPREMAQAFNAFGSYIMGFVMMEQGLMPGRDHHEHAHQHEEVAEALREAGLPLLMTCFEYFAECPTDDQFEFGLELMVDGLRAASERSNAERVGP
jgi:AcrR family transcriptional regulator